MSLLSDSPKIWVGIGRLPYRKGFWLFEVDGSIYRALAKFRDEASADRFMLLAQKGLKMEVDLDETYRDAEEAT